MLANKDLHLRGREGATLEAPDSMDTFQIVESLSTWAPVLFAYGGGVSSGEVSGSEVVDVDVTGLTVDGRGDTSQSGRKTAVLFRNVGRTDPARVAGNDVVDLGVPGDTIGIVAYGDSTVRAEDNRLVGFGRGGIGANGDGGAHPSPEITVRGNEIDAQASAGGSAPNGVQIGFGASGTVQRNVIRNCRYATGTDGLFQSSGVLVFESDGVAVRGNSLTNNDVAVAVSAWGWFLESASNCKVTRNEVSDALIGANLRATAWDQDGGLAFLTNQDPSVGNNKIVNNEFVDPQGGPTGEVGIAVESNDRGDDDQYEPAVGNNKVVRNHIRGFDEGVVDEGSATKTAAQVIEP